MTQEEKDLLLKDLCGRLPYGVKLDTLDGPQELNTKWLTINMCNISNPYLPYLFPLSSMTEEQWNNGSRVNLTEFTFESFKCGCATIASYTCDNDLHDLVEFINWLIENHFDVNGLIEKGLAIDATNLNVY